MDCQKRTFSFLGAKLVSNEMVVSVMRAMYEVKIRILHLSIVSAAVSGKWTTDVR